LRETSKASSAYDSTGQTQLKSHERNKIVLNGPNWRLEPIFNCYGGTHCGYLCSSARVVAPPEFKLPVNGHDPRTRDAFTDYCLCHPDGTVRAAIEAVGPNYLRDFSLQRDHK
jgi:hypothetical protein